MRHLIFVLIILGSCQTDIQDIWLAQGIMAGEVTPNSVILQSRLTAADTLVNDDVPGKEGKGQFEIDEDPGFSNPQTTKYLYATAEGDNVLKTKVDGLNSGTKYYYRLKYGSGESQEYYSDTGSFTTLAGAEKSSEISMAVVTGMNYYHFHYGKYDSTKAYSGEDKHLGYPALATIKEMGHDFFIGTGDNVYFDHPVKGAYENALKRGQKAHPGRNGGEEVKSEKGMRRKYHEQFVQPRFRELFLETATYWEKDDHDYRYNDADPYMDLPISHELGIKNFREQLPVVDPEDESAVTYRTHRMNKDLQIWLLEGRDYRSPNNMEDGPEKTLLGAEQIAWLKRSLLNSDATYKLIISPTPVVGPDDAYKSDNHVNPKGFRHEGEALFSWLKQNGFLEKNLYFICGDRHWQYHARHPSGFEEFSTGALVDNNSRPGRVAGDPNSTDPDSLIQQFYIQKTQESATGGFLSVKIDETPSLTFTFFDEKGNLHYEVVK